LSPRIEVSETKLLESGSVAAGLRDIVGLARDVGMELDMSLEDLSRLFGVFRTNARALEEYERKRYRGSLSLVTARESDTDCAGWRDLAGDRVHTITLAGDHYTIFQEPHLSTLSKELTALLEAARNSQIPAPAADPGPTQHSTFVD
jgi:hypothetical protein